MRWITQQCKPHKPQEPDYIASLSIHLPQDLSKILKLVFPSLEFSVTSVYCHQKPIVNIGLKKNPELGDLLLVYADKNNGVRRLNSLLLQAKISNSITLPITSEEQHQFTLYNKWPEFTYFRAGRLNTEKRNVLPKTINDGAQYLLIDDNPLTNGLCGCPNMFPMGCAMPFNPLCIENTLSEEITGLLRFKSGRAFEEFHPNLADHWSMMMWDLLEISSHIPPTKRKNANLIFERKNECGKIQFTSAGFHEKSILEELNIVSKNDDKPPEEVVGVPTIIIESITNTEQG